MDKAYNNYKLFDQWNKSNIHFETRLKNNAQEELIEELELKPATPNNIFKDAKIALTYRDDNGQQVKFEFRLVSAFTTKKKTRLTTFLPTYLI